MHTRCQPRLVLQTMFPLLGSHLQGSVDVFLTGPQIQSRRPYLLERGGVLYGPVVKESLRSCAMLNTYIYVYVHLGQYPSLMFVTGRACT